MSNPYAPPSVNESKTGNTFLWQIGGLTFITLGLMIPLIFMTLIGGLPIGLGALFALLILSAGIAMVALSLPAQTESEKRWRRMLLWLIPLLAVLIMGGTLFVHTVRLTSRVRQVRQEAMYQRHLAQKAAEQAERLQKKVGESPTRD